MHTVRYRMIYRLLQGVPGLTLLITCKTSIAIPYEKVLGIPTLSHHGMYVCIYVYTLQCVYIFLFVFSVCKRVSIVCVIVLVCETKSHVSVTYKDIHMYTLREGAGTAQPQQPGYIYIYIYIPTYIYTHQVRACLYTMYICLFSHKHIYTRIYIHTYIHTHQVRACLYTMYICLFTHKHIYTRIFYRPGWHTPCENSSHKNMYIYINIYIYICIYICSRCGMTHIMRNSSAPEAHSHDAIRKISVRMCLCVAAYACSQTYIYAHT
jgi:hypothetical protein